VELSPQLIALASTAVYAAGNLYARVGLVHSTPLVVTLISLIVQTSVVWTLLLGWGGVPSADPRGGNREVMPTIARAGVAAGVDGVFIEIHPDPACAKCDAASQLDMSLLEEFMKPLLDLHAVEVKHRHQPVHA